MITQTALNPLNSTGLDSPAPPPARMMCDNCRSRTAAVQLQEQGALLCWYCTAQDFMLIGKHPCMACGETSTVQITSGDGITRPYCHVCSGVRPDLHDYEY